MVTVAEAEEIIRSQVRHYGTETVAYQHAQGRILAENLLADRDFPPFNRAMVDGIAIHFDSYQRGIRSFEIGGVQAAGDMPIPLTAPHGCIEIMTGAALDPTLDTVIKVEDIRINDRVAYLNMPLVKKGMYVHTKGSDKKKHELVAAANTVVTPALIGLAASIGKTELLVRKPPRVIIITTGDEMVSPSDHPTPYQLRRSNGITIQAVLQQYAVSADLLHLLDDYDLIKRELSRCVAEYDVLLLCGGVSKGKFDHVPHVLDELATKKLFHGVFQKPGKPFFFGSHGDHALIFAFPGNPVSTFMCLHRYFIPWLTNTLTLKPPIPEYAVLQHDFSIAGNLQYFAQVRLQSDEHARLYASTVGSNNSGDFSQLNYADAFMEFPLGDHAAKKGACYRIWRYHFNK